MKKVSVIYEIIGKIVGDAHPDVPYEIRISKMILMLFPVPEKIYALVVCG